MLMMTAASQQTMTSSARGAYTFVRQLARQHADVPSAAAWYSLPSLVDQIALSVAKIDEAYFVLENMHSQASTGDTVDPLSVAGDVADGSMLRRWKP
jgi:hypothetical protein